MKQTYQYTKLLAVCTAIFVLQFLLVNSAAADGVGPVIITELMASNNTVYQDEDGDYSDWVEIYNDGASPVNLSGWYLTDQSANLTRWQFPSVTINPGQYIVVFASGKNRTSPILHTNFSLSRTGEYLALVQPDGSTIAWEYSPQFPEQVTDYSYGIDLPNKNERYYSVPTPGIANETAAVNKTPIIQAIDHTPTTPLTTDDVILTAAVFASNAPIDTVTAHYVIAGNATVYDVVLADDGLNGDGAAADGVYGAIVSAGTFAANDIVDYYVTASNTDGNSSRNPFNVAENATFTVTPAGTQTLYINEMMASNAAAFIDGDAWDFNDWIEIYNPGATDVTIGGHYLTNDLDIATMWQITPLTATIPAGGYAIFWADEEDIGNRTNFKLDADGGEIGLFDSGGTLVDAIIFGLQMTDVSYGRETDGSQNLRFFGQSTGKASNNAAEAFVDTSMVAPKPNMSVASGFYTATQSVALSNTLPGSQIWYTTDGSLPTLSNGTLYNGSPIAINSTTTLRARTFRAGYIPSKTESRTIFINANSTLPIVSISINPEYLNDSIIGIFVAGSNGIPKSNCEGYQPRNYFQPWERPIAVQIFEPDGDKVIDMDAGLRTYGNCSRNASHKSITIRARDRYGDDDLSYKFFDDRDVDQFPVILMRNGGQDYTDTLMRDATAQSVMAGQADFDYQEYEPAVVYINGQYRGILNFREKIDERFVETYYGYTEDQIEMIDRVRYGPTQPILEPRIGTMDDYNDLMAFVKNNDMTDPAIYDLVTQRIDINAHMNYYIAQIYNATTDWPSNNVRMWRPLDGKWRWMLFDTESGFRSSQINTNNLARATSNGPEWAYIIMQRLMVNQTYREEFAQRYAAHLNITFDPDRVIGIIDEHEAALAPEIPAHQSRWGFPSNWATRVDDLRAFALARPATQFSHVINYNGSDRITATAPLNIVTYPAGGGEIRVHDVPVPSDDFTGDFFTTIPIRLEATAKPGFRFIGWQQAAQADITDAVTTIAINGSHTITAVFEEVSPVVINEIHYHPTDVQGANEEYIELFNTSTTDTIDLSNYSFTNGITYTFPAAISLPPQSYLLLAHPNSVAYGTADCPVYKWSSGRLSNDGEALELSNNVAEVADYVDYNDQTPWPVEADGTGPAMALYDATADNTDPTNWRASLAEGGTPCAANVVTVLAVDDDFTVEYGFTNNLFSTVLDNDQAGFEGDTLSITAVGTPLLGTIDGFTADTIRYSAPAAAGSDSFTYTVMNSLGLTSTAQIDVTITPPLPGGVDNSLVMWLKADAGTNTTIDGQNVTTWADQAGNHDASNLTAPTYQNGALNFNPMVDFSGGNMGLTINNAGDINTSSFTAKTFCIAFTTGTDVVTRQMVYEQGGGTNGINIYVLNNQLYANLWASNQNNAGSTPITAETEALVCLVYDGQSFEAYLNGQQFLNDTTVPASLPAHSGRVGIGQMYNASRYHDANGSGDGDYFSGQIAELLHYNAALSNAERQQIETYLAIRYGITLPVDGYRYKDGITLLYNIATHDQAIAGIGLHAAVALDQPQSRSVNADARVTMTAALPNHSYAIWGTSGGNGLTSADVSLNYIERLSRTWAISTYGNFTQVDTIVIDLSGWLVGGTTAADLYLVRDADGIFADAAPGVQAVSLNADVATFTNVAFSDGDYFTVAIGPAADSDNDGIADRIECSAGPPYDVATCQDADGDGTPDFLDPLTLCGLSQFAAGQPWLFNTSHPLSLTVNSLGSLDCVRVTEIAGQHPSGTINSFAVDNGWYYAIEGYNAARQLDVPNGSFNVTLVMKSSFTTTANSKMCRYLDVVNGGPRWDCGGVATGTNQLTRSGITGFSEWSAGEGIGPTAVTLSSQNTAVDVDTQLWLLWLTAGLLSILTLLSLQRRQHIVARNRRQN